MLFGAQRRSPDIANRTRLSDLAILAAALVAIVWPYVRYPGEILYNRYFEAAMIFNPAFAYHMYATGWSRELHLGYPSLTEPSYLSVFTFAILLLHFGGTVFASHVYPIIVALFTFGSMALYLRAKPWTLSLPARTLVAFFFTINPLTAGMVHEGYSGMMVDYAMIPLGLWLVDRAIALNVPLALGAFPLVFTVTSMFKLPQVAIAWGVVAFLRWGVLSAAVRRNPRLAVAFVAALAANAYWAFPMLLNLKLHAYLPIQGDTASEVAVSTQYSNLSNILLSRVFGIFESNARLCTACTYYTSAAYTLGMCAIVGFAAWGFWRARAWKGVALLVAGVILSTGYHYQDDIIGIPYQLLMQLPTFGIFRSSNVFLTLVFFAYTIGLAYALEASASAGKPRTIAIGVLAAVVVVSWPMIDGSILEKQELVDHTVPSPNFYVTIPPEYAEARDALGQMPPDGTTLLLPNQPFASYRFGAYVQDFLPPFLGRPTLARWYWKQNNPDVDTLLGSVTGPQLSALRLTYLMSAMRIDSIFVHDDSTYPKAEHAARYGVPVFRRGAVTIYKPRLPIVPLLTDDVSTIVGIGGAAQDVPVLESLTGRTVSDGAARIGCDANDVGFSFIRGATISRSPVTVPLAAACDGRVTINAYVSEKNRASYPSIGVWRRKKIVEHSNPVATPSGLVQRLSGTLALRRGDLIAILPKVSGQNILGIVAGRNLAQNVSERAVDFPLRFGAFAVPRLDPDASIFVLHEASDPSWVALTMRNGAPTLVPKFVADGYANGWTIVPGSAVLIVNLAQLAFLGGLAIAVIALVVVWSISIAPWIFASARKEAR